MRNFLSVLLNGAAFSILAGSFFFGHPGEAHAQNRNLFCPDGFSLYGGACTSNPGVVDPAGLSGAALASQALSDLSQSATQETNRTLGSTIVERRAREEQRCAPGFSMVDGACTPIAKPAPEAPAAAPPPRAERPAPRRAKVVHAAKRAPKAAPAAEVVARKPAAVPAPLPLPPPVEPEARFAVWTQVYGDYEQRDASTILTSVVTPPPGVAIQFVGLNTDVHSQTGTVGFLAGGDFTSRGVLAAGDGVIAGAMAGYVSANLNLQTTQVPNTPVSGCTGNCNSLSHTFARTTGPSAGLYGTYFNGPFSTDLSLKVDVLDLSQNFDNWVTLFAPGVGPGAIPVLDRQALVLNGGSTSLLNTTVAANVNYRFDLQPNLWIEPTVGVQYTNSTYGGGAAELGLADGSLVMIQGGARLGSNFFWNNVRMTATLTGLAYDDVLVQGGFVAGAGFLANNILAQADEGQLRGRGVLALNADFGQGVSSFVQAEVRGGKGLFGAGGKAGVRYQW